MKPSVRLTSFLTQYVELSFDYKELRPLTPSGRGGRRMVVAWALRTLCPGLSFSAIAHRLGYSDHTSALHAFSWGEDARDMITGFRAATDKLLADAQAQHAGTIAEINVLHTAKPRAEELQSIMTDVRRAANRLEKTLDRLNTYMERAQ